MNSTIQEKVLNAVGNHVLESLHAQEERIDLEIKKLEEMEDDDIEKLREKRLKQLKETAKEKEKWKNYGHGIYTELTTQQEFFDIIKNSDNVIVHFYNGTNLYCTILDKHFEILSKNHMETKFCRMNGEKADYLVQKLGIWMIPCIALIKKKSVLHMIQGLDELGGTEQFSTFYLEYYLSCKNILKFDGNIPTSIYDTGKDMKKSIGSIRQSKFDYNSDDEQYD